MIKVIVMDDQNLMRDGLEVILNSCPEIHVEACGENGQQAVELAEKYNPDLVLMDIRMPIMDGVAATKIIKDKYPHIKVLLLTTFEDEEYIINAMNSGASGYIFKDIEKERLIEAIKDCVKGQFIMPTKVASVLARRALNNIKAESNELIGSVELLKKDLDFTDREMEVAIMLAQGFTNKQIASALYITDGTVKNHVCSIYNKTGFKDRIKLALFLKEKGIS
jgi:DNA-binding NarL/FixJ family response regulator